LGTGFLTLKSIGGANLTSFLILTSSLHLHHEIQVCKVFANRHEANLTSTDDGNQ